MKWLMKNRTWLFSGIALAISSIALASPLALIGWIINLNEPIDPPDRIPANQTLQINGNISPSPIIQVGGDLNYAGLAEGQYQILLAKLDGNKRLLDQFLNQIDQQ